MFLRDHQRDLYIENKRSITHERHWVTWSWDGEDLSSLHHLALSALVEQLERSEKPFLFSI